MNRRESIYLLVGTGALCGAPIVLAQVRDINDAINKAGRQRMLSQRMAKSYFAIRCAACVLATANSTVNVTSGMSQSPCEWSVARTRSAVACEAHSAAPLTSG